MMMIIPRFNLRKWFCQSFTVGISHVIAGLRDDEGVVHKLNVFPVEALAKEGRVKNSYSISIT